MLFKLFLMELVWEPAPTLARSRLPGQTTRAQPVSDEISAFDRKSYENCLSEKIGTKVPAAGFGRHVNWRA